MQTVSQAFTLIELLVVVAVIAVLAALLLPTLSRAKLKAQQTTCLNNQRQLQLGWMMYVNDNKDTLPLNTQEQTPYSRNFSTPNSWVVGDTTVSADLSFIERGSIFRYVLNPGIYHCPSDHSTVVHSTQLRTRSYSLDYYLNGGFVGWFPELPLTAQPGPFIQCSQISHPSESLAFLDENESTIEDGIFLLFRFPDQTWQNAPSGRHSQGMNLSFVDGHCEYWKWHHPKTMQTLSERADGPDDLKDLRRLQAALAGAPSHLTLP